MIDACWTFDAQYRPSFAIICDILEQNKFDLASLSPSEMQQVSSMINEYKTQIPNYSE